jgi:hypothetical protein
MPSVGFEPTIPASEWPHTHARGTSLINSYGIKCCDECCFTVSGIKQCFITGLLVQMVRLSPWEVCCAQSGTVVYFFQFLQQCLLVKPLLLHRYPPTCNSQTRKENVTVVYSVIKMGEALSLSGIWHIKECKVVEKGTTVPVHAMKVLGGNEM